MTVSAANWPSEHSKVKKKILLSFSYLFFATRPPIFVYGTYFLISQKHLRDILKSDGLGNHSKELK